MKRAVVSSVGEVEHYQRLRTIVAVRKPNNVTMPSVPHLRVLIKNFACELSGHQARFRRLQMSSQSGEA
jgi:hypothetical protein